MYEGYECKNFPTCLLYLEIITKKKKTLHRTGKKRKLFSFVDNRGCCWRVLTHFLSINEYTVFFFSFKVWYFIYINGILSSGLVQKV